ncbi:hypothetical protein FHR25_002502 [Yokenella regensburgei]|nr:hypothetical protein FHR25_002502 [Yokenella regensburgei]
MSFVKDKAAYNTALIFFINYGEEYRHIADLFMRKAYGC